MCSVRLPLWLLVLLAALSAVLFTDDSAMEAFSNKLATGVEILEKAHNLFEDVVSAILEEREKQNQEAQLMYPKTAMREQAELALENAISGGTLEEDCKVLLNLQTVGFKMYISPVFFRVPDEPEKIATAVKEKLKNVPEATSWSVAKLLEIADMAESMTTFYEFSADGKGVYTKVVYKMASVNGTKSIALLPYGVEFETAKVVDHYEYLTEPVTRIVTEEEKVLKSDAGWFSKAEYQLAKKEKIEVVGTTSTQKPVFKQHILDMRRQEAMLRALEFAANQQVLRMLQ